MIALAALATGCGGGGEGSTTTTTGPTPAQRAQERIRHFGLEATGAEAKQARSALQGYLDARVAGEWSKACSYLAKPIRTLFGRFDSKSQESQETKTKGCAGFVERSTRKLSPSERADLAKIKVTSVRVEDEQGYVLYKDAAGVERATSMKIEGGKWKVAGVTGTPLE